VGNCVLAPSKIKKYNGMMEVRAGPSGVPKNVPLTLPHDALGVRVVPRRESGATVPCDCGGPGCTARLEDTALRTAQAFAKMDAKDFQRAVDAEKIKRKPKRSKFA